MLTEFLFARKGKIMKFHCDKNKLADGLNTALKAVSSRSTLPILQSFLLKSQKGELKCIGNDLEMGIEVTIPASIEEEGMIAVNARMFFEIIRKMPDGEITISSEGSTVKIASAHSEFNINAEDSKEFIMLPQVERNNPLVLSQGILKKKISQTIFSISLDDNRKVLQGELFDIIDNRLNLVAIDGYRISIQTMNLKVNFPETSVIIPGKTLSEVQKILSSEETEEVSIYFTDKHVLFEIEQTIVVSRIIEGSFPKYMQMFSEDFKTSVEVNRHQLLYGIERAALLARESKKAPVKLELKDGNLIITSNTELGTVYEEIQIEQIGDNLVIAFNPRYLMEALKVIEEETVNLRLTISSNPCIIKPSINQENQDYKYLILPIRMVN